ncbi:non-oxidative hydroxyarylic acid decarboxylases subunit C [Neomoorella thermoacetica]|uniref:non-oxidative hydroxyarylic acid decarboxylases subunit C n=1 Tax=Neomoorella thermoacetica TaxID=1525 RepID=UPI0008FB780A|nr:non-oxidative hydroxyarylic acid decarboxylases subunit C [Moorella thermoacetica]OIQ52757.1 phenolic acid decarboxylase subunit C [Moorella thermoacetica]
MSFRDLRSYLDKLEKGGQLVYIHDEILPEPEIRKYARAAVDLPGGPAVIMDNIKGYKGKRVAVNVHGSWANIALMLDMPKTATLREQFYEFDRRWSNPEAGEVKFIQNAPCQEVVIDKDINLFNIIPLFRVNRFDGGCYFAKASVISKDPDEPDNFDKENVGMYRLQVQGPDIIGMQALAFHDISIQLRKAEERNEPLPVAIALGVDPYLSMVACTPLRYDQSEYKFASALSGVPQEVTKAVTCDLDVPANAEYVIEGEIIPRQRFVEGPFGEMPGSYSGVRRQVRIKVKAVTHRKDPIFENLYVGRPWTEHDYLIALSTSVPLYRQLKETMPEVVAVNAIYQHGLTAIVATGNRFGGYAKSVAFRLASTPHGISYCKNIILVDADVDPFNLVEVMWAMSTRVRADKDVIVIPNTPGMPLDPASEPPGMGNKLIIDATTPVAPEKVMREVRMVEKIEEAVAYQKVLAELQSRAGR